MRSKPTTTRKKRAAPKRRGRFTAKQLAAQRRFARAAKKGKIRKGARL